MKTRSTMDRRGFTLVEILAVIAIVAILASILVPVAGRAMETARKRRAVAEMNSIKVAVLEFQSDHKYMPWTDVVKVGADKWVLSEADQMAVMNMLTGSNAMRKAYLQIPEKSRPADKSMLFLDPWSGKAGFNTFYAIGMDRNLDGAVTILGTGVAGWEGKTVMEKVLVYPTGDPETDPEKRLKTFDVQ
jgi:prepilin-type N-terminal cleavage/methylation domain-containing protein